MQLYRVMRRGYSRKRDKQPSAGSVDLGLGAIMNGALPAEEPDKLSAHKVESAAVAAAGAGRTYQQLAALEAWKELAALCDKHLQEGVAAPDSSSRLEARLWWIYSQLKLKSVPASILAAPLDGASKLLLDRLSSPEADRGYKELRLMASGLLEEAAEILRLGSEGQLALIFDQRAAQLQGLLSGQELPVQNSGGAVQRGGEMPVRDLQQTQHRAQGVRSGLRPIIAVAVIAVMVGALGGLWILGAHLIASPKGIWPAEGSSRDAQPGFSLLETANMARPVEPVLERSARVSRLDTLFYELQSEPNKVPAPALASSQPAARSPRVESKETVNTTSPVEERRLDVKSAEPAGISRPSEASALPSALTSRVSVAPSFEEFKRDRAYSVLVATRVMAEPSLKAEALGRLNPGDKILAQGKHGYWLRIRSRQGRSGYVLAQDATPEQQW